jgi:hypothetical protein
MSVLQPRKQSNVGARQQHLIFGVGDAVADVLVEKIGAHYTECHFAQLIGSRFGGFPRVADLCTQVVIARRRSLGDGRDIILSEGVKQPDPSEPRIVPPVNSTTDANGRNTGHVGAIGKGGSHHIELVFDANKSVSDRDDVPLALKLTATEDGVCLRIDRFVEIAYAGTACAVVSASVSSKLTEDESVEPRVVDRCFKSEGAIGAS